METNFFVGIDYGTSNTCSGVYINNKVKISPNKIGERITPSVVLFENDKKYVGEEALCESFGNDKNFISEVKRFIGLNYEEFRELGFDKSIKNYIVKNIDGIPQIEIENNGQKIYYTAEDISSFIIKKILMSTEDFIAEIREGTKIKSAIFTVPAQFTDHQKNGIINAAKKAGVEIPRIINEPTAAALAYGFGHKLISNQKEEEKIFNSTIIGDDYELDQSNQLLGDKKQKKKLMVFDLGGGTFDISILNLNIINNSLDFEVISTDGDIHLGGSDFDDILKDYCIDFFCKNNKINKEELKKDSNALRRLKIKCENAKKILSIKNKATILINNFYNNKNLIINITNEYFREICKSIYIKIENKINLTLNESDLTADNINYVILIGGGSKIYGIKKLLIDKFGENKIKDDINPEEAVAIGATLYAVKTQGNQDIDFNLQDILPFNIGIAVKNKVKEEAHNGDVMNIIFPRYTKFPANLEKGKNYKVNLNERHPDIIVKVYEGNNKFVKYNTRIGGFHIKNLNKEGTYQYLLKFNIDLNGKLNGELICDELNLKENYKSINPPPDGKKVIIPRNNRLSTVASMIADINDKKELIKGCLSFNDKLKNIEVCAHIYENLIKNYLPFTKYNENLFEKLFIYTKELFSFYVDMINPKENTKGKIDRIIKEIKDRMNSLIKEPDYVEELMKIFKDLKKEFKNEFYQIFVNYIELLNNEGIILSNGHFSRYYIKLYFEKVFLSKIKYIKDEKDILTINPEIKERYIQQMKITDEGLAKTNSFAYYVETMVKEGKFVPGKTGYTWIDKKIKKLKENPTEEEIHEILELFHDMLGAFDPKEKTIEEAFCLANIIIINYDNLNVRDYEKLANYIAKFKRIMKEKNVENKPWYEETMKIINQLENNEI